MNLYSIADNFNCLFKVKLAKNKQLKQEAFKIRYKVYSQELGWEPENKLKLETDSCDNYAYHCVLEHRRTQTLAGCVRLVVPPEDNLSLKLPFETNGLKSTRTNIVDPTILKRGSFGEVSRLAVLDTFRRRTQENNTPFIFRGMPPETLFTEEEQRNFPNIAIGLYLAALALADICNHQGIFVMMESRLNKRLKRFGLPFEQVSEEVDYHGIRALYYLKRESFHSELSEELLALYQIIYNDLSQQINLIPFSSIKDEKKKTKNESAF